MDHYQWLWFAFIGLSALLGVLTALATFFGLWAYGAQQWGAFAFVMGWLPAGIAAFVLGWLVAFLWLPGILIAGLISIGIEAANNRTARIMSERRMGQS